MVSIRTLDLIATVRFDRDSFFNVIDDDNRLGIDYKLHLWEQYENLPDNGGSKLLRFYNGLQYPQESYSYIKESMNRFFDRKTIEYLQSKDMM